MTQTVNDNGTPPSHKVHLSGQKNLKNIDNCSHVSREKQKILSRILSGSISMVQIVTHSLVVTTKFNADGSRQQGYSRVCCFLRRKFHHINSSSFSTEAHKQKTFKRIKLIFESSDDEDIPPLT